MLRNIILLTLGIIMLGLASCKKEKKVYNQGEPIDPDDIHWVLEYLIDSTDLKIYFPDRDVRDYLHDDLKTFYEYNEYKLAWNSHNKPKKQAEELIEVLMDSWREGLEPSNYRLTEIDSLEKEIFKRGVDSVDLHRLIHLDLIMTSSFLTYASHLVNGRVDPHTLNKTWFTNPSSKNLTPLLKEAVDKNNVKKAVEEIRPNYPQYKKLQEKLVEYHEINKNGGWPTIKEGPELAWGVSNPRVAALKRRLAITGDLPDFKPKAKDSSEFTADLENAVKNFQQRHRLEQSGRVNQKTLQALNISATDRVNQIKLNLERLRWMPDELGQHYILVNVPEYHLRIVKNDKTEMEMRVIVGEEFNSTPIFSDTMEHLVFSPYWNVPRSIATGEILPKVKNNPGYLAAEHYELLTGWDKDADTVDPYYVEWETIDSLNFPYRIRQKPGPWNALGKVKFMFPNEMSIYLHDTPTDHLFASEERGFSHGCIRVEKPKDMAEYLLQDQPEYDRKRIEELMQKDSETYVNLKEQLPVHIIYWTTFVDEDGKLNFSNDIYSFDKAQIEALLQKEKVM